MSRYGPGFGLAISKVLTGCVAGAAVVEMASLSGIKALSDTQTTASKVMKYCLAAIAIASAVFVTLGAGLAPLACAEYQIVSLGFNEAVPFLFSLITATSTIPLHWKAFRSSRLF